MGSRPRVVTARRDGDRRSCGFDVANSVRQIPAKKKTKPSKTRISKIANTGMNFFFTEQSSDFAYCRGVGRTRGIGRGLGVTLGVAVGVGVGLGVGVGPNCKQYLPPVSR